MTGVQTCALPISELDRLGIEYAPKARTTTLEDLLEDALAKQAKAQTDVQFAPAQAVVAAASVTEAPKEGAPLFGGIFGAPAEPEPVAPKEPVKETPPFDVDDDDNRPLFGS